MLNPIQKYKQSQQESLNLDLLEYCSSNYSVEYIRNKIDRGADIHCTAATGKTPIELTSSEEIITLLLEKGAGFSSPELLNKALYHCVHKAQTLATLIAMGADVNFIRNGVKPLIFYVTAPDDKDNLAFLLKNNLDVNVKDRYNNTPLHQAIRDKCVSAVEGLFHYGARLDVKNDENETPLEMARRLYKDTHEHYYQKMLEAFHADTAKPETSIVTDDEKISFIREEPALGQRITETFNFKSGQYREVIYCEKTNTQSSSMTVFEQLEGSRLLLAAEAEFIKQGGVPVYSSRKRLDKI
jgi:hypothetical protein